MKQHVILLSLILLTYFEATAQLQKETRIFEAFDKIKASKGVNVTLIEGDEPSMEIHIRNASTSDVITEIENRTLNIRLRTKIYRNMAVQVYVTYASLREIDAGSGATFDCEEPVTAENLKITAGTETSIELEVAVNNSLELDLMAAKVSIKGSANFQQVNANTGAKYHAFGLDAKETTVKAGTGALVQVNASEKLDISASSASTVEYQNTPKSFNYKVTVGGKVKQVGKQ